MPEPIRGTGGWVTRLDDEGHPVGPRLPLVDSVSFQVDRDDDDLFTRRDAFTIQMQPYSWDGTPQGEPVQVRVPMLLPRAYPELRDIMARVNARVQAQARALGATRPTMERALEQVSRAFQVPPAAIGHGVGMQAAIRAAAQAQRDAMNQQLLTPRGVRRSEDLPDTDATTRQWWRDSQEALRRAGYAAWHRRLWEQEWADQDSPQARQEAQYERDLINERAHRAMELGSEELRLWDEMWEDPRLSMRWTGGTGERRAHP